jgi:cytosine deaminase
MLRCAYAHGTLAIRTHLDTSGSHRDMVWSVFREVQQRWTGKIELQAVSLGSLSQLSGDEGHAIARQVAATQGGVLGGSAINDPNLDAGLNRLFELAQAYDLDLDLHVDENGLSPGTALKGIAKAIQRVRFRGKVLCGHCCSLSVQDNASRRDIIARVADTGIGIVSLPMCNMYLQDRVAGRTPRWRGITAIRELAAAGVPLMLASDNVRDPFFAYGDLDMLEVFREGVRIAHLDHPLDLWPRAVTASPAAWMGRVGSIQAGQPADLLVFDAGSFNELLSRPHSDRVVIRNGAQISAVPPRYRELDGRLGGAASEVCITE